jgi:hypothetical protein
MDGVDDVALGLPGPGPSRRAQRRGNEGRRIAVLAGAPLTGSGLIAT